MEDLPKYIRKTLGADVHLEEVQSKDFDRLPFYVKGLFRIHRFKLMGREIVLAEAREDQTLTATLVHKQLQKIKEVLGGTPVLASRNLSSSLRGRLIEKRINFVVPGKNLFLPDLMIDMSERNDAPKVHREILLPSAQVLVLYWLLRRSDKMEVYTLKELADELKYEPITVTYAVANLVQMNLCEVHGKKPKHVRFCQTRAELWQQALPMMTSPVRKVINLDEAPRRTALYKSNTSALAQYSDINEEVRAYFAVDKKAFAAIKKEVTIVDPNDVDSTICLELWKYNPGVLAGDDKERNTVDRLSLFLSLRGSQDERIEKALEQMIGDMQW